MPARRTNGQTQYKAYLEKSPWGNQSFSLKYPSFWTFFYCLWGVISLLSIRPQSIQKWHQVQEKHMASKQTTSFLTLYFVLWEVHKRGNIQRQKTNTPQEKSYELKCTLFQIIFHPLTPCQGWMKLFKHLTICVYRQSGLHARKKHILPQLCNSAYQTFIFQGYLRMGNHIVEDIHFPKFLLKPAQCLWHKTEPGLLWKVTANKKYITHSKDY